MDSMPDDQNQIYILKQNIHRHSIALYSVVAFLVLSTLSVVIYLTYNTPKPPSVPASAKQPPVKKEPEVVVNTEYQNPFDKNTQYVNPFSQYKNPFDSLK